MTSRATDPDGIELTIENDWVTDSCVRAVKRGSLVFLIGTVDATDATDPQIAALPDGYRPTEEVTNGLTTIGTDGTITSDETAAVYLTGLCFWTGSK